MSGMRPLDHPTPPALDMAPVRDPQPRRLSASVAFSLVLHALVLSLTIGGQGFGRPGFGLPWQERRIEVPELQVFLLPPADSAVAPEATTSPPPSSLSSPLSATAPAPVPAPVHERLEASLLVTEVQPAAPVEAAPVPAPPRRPPRPAPRHRQPPPDRS